MQSPFVRSAATGILIAAVLVTAVWLLARATGDDLRIETTNGELQGLPIYIPAVFTVVLGAIATGIAVLFRRRGWSARVFVGIAIAFLIIYGIFAFSDPSGIDTTGTAIWLNVMHLAAAAGIAPPLARGIARSI